jgi:hypothetical protein
MSPTLTMGCGDMSCSVQVLAVMQIWLPFPGVMARSSKEHTREAT